MIYEQLRRTFHKAIKSGKSPLEIAEEHDVLEIDVVQTLRHGIPKIKGANYTHLKIPIPLDEIIEAHHENEMDTLAEMYGVTKATLYSRLPKDLRKGHGGRRKKVDLMKPVDKVDVVNRYYRSGRKLNACGVSSTIARSVLEEEGVRVKEHGLGIVSISPRNQVAIIDGLIEFTSQGSLSSKQLFQLHRLTYELTSNEPKQWKGQLLDWLLKGVITHEQVLLFNNAIDEVEKIKGYSENIS